MKVIVYPVMPVDGELRLPFENIIRVCLRGEGELLSLTFADGAQLDYVVPNLLGWYTEKEPGDVEQEEKER